MQDDRESKDPKSSNEDEEKILEMLKGGFETEYLLQQRVRATEIDAERGEKTES